LIAHAVGDPVRAFDSRVDLLRVGRGHGFGWARRAVGARLSLSASFRSSHGCSRRLDPRADSDRVVVVHAKSLLGGSVAGRPDLMRSASGASRGGSANDGYLAQYTQIRILVWYPGEAKPVRWIGSSRRDLRAFPKAVRRDIGQALYAAQRGEEYPSVKA